MNSNKESLCVIMISCLCLVAPLPAAGEAPDLHIAAKEAALKKADLQPAELEVGIVAKRGQSVKTASTIKWQVISAGGGYGMSTSYQLNNTVGQTAIGHSASASYQINSGFWQRFMPSGSCCVLAGDVSQDGNYNISDAVYVINNVFKGGPLPTCCDAADTNADGSYNISDAVQIINNVFKGGPSPVCGFAGNGPCP